MTKNRKRPSGTNGTSSKDSSMDRITVAIRNFKCCEDKIVTLPTSGTVKLTGPNGSGKSTILNAISWCLYGIPGTTVDYSKKESTRKPAKVVVELPPSLTSSGRWMKVTRKTQPHTLEVKLLEKREVQDASPRSPPANSRKRSSVSCAPKAKRSKISDDSTTNSREANQALIHNELVSKSVWSGFSFLTHDKCKDFFSLPAAAMKDLILDIRGDSEQAQELEARVNQKIKTLIGEQTILSGKIMQTSELLETMLTNISLKNSKWNVDDSLQELDAVGDKLMVDMHASESELELETEARCKEQKCTFILEQIESLKVDKSLKLEQLESINSAKVPICIQGLQQLLPEGEEESYVMELLKECETQQVHRVGVLLCEKIPERSSARPATSRRKDRASHRRSRRC